MFGPYIIIKEKFIGKLKFIISETGCDIPDVITDRVHRKGYVDNKLNRFCKNIILQFTTFRLRTMLYWNGNQLKKAKVKLDLTKKRDTTHIDDASFVKHYSFNFVMVNINSIESCFTNGHSFFFVLVLVSVLVI